MRLSIDHRTSYRFSAPQSRLVQMLRLTPEDTHDQTVAAWRIDVDCDARLRTTRDGFGNIVTMLYAEGPLTAIEVAVSRFAELRELEREVAGLSERFEARKLIDRAKGLLMAKHAMTEPEAFRWIQRAAMDRRTTMKQVAEVIVDTLGSEAAG
jgi:hypothetical protein